MRYVAATARRTNVPRSTRDAPPGGHVDDVAEPLCLHLDVEDREHDRDDGHGHAHDLGLVEVGEHVGRRDVAERLAERPDARADHVGDRPDQERPGAGRPEPDPLGIEEPAGAQEREGRVEGRDHGQVEDEEPRLAPVEEEVLQVHRHLLVGYHAQHERDQEIDDDQPGGDHPGRHQTSLRSVQRSTPMSARYTPRSTA